MSFYTDDNEATGGDITYIARYTEVARHYLMHGIEHPYDGDIPARSWAHEAARGVISDLTDRAGIKNGFRNVDDETKAEIVESLEYIINLAFELRKDAK